MPKISGHRGATHYTGHHRQGAQAEPAETPTEPEAEELGGTLTFGGELEVVKAEDAEKPAKRAGRAPRKTGD